MITKTGSFTGNSTDNRTLSGVGFQPDLVIILGTDANVNAHFRTSAMGANESISIRGDAPSVTDAIKTFTIDGFTLGISSVVNNTGTNYVYFAVKDNGAGDFKVGSYTGDGNDGKVITGVGFQPNYVLTKSSSAIVGASKYAGTTDSQMQFDGTDRIDLYASLDADGFTVNNGSASAANLINVSGVTHYYFAFKEVANFCKVFAYAGDSTDNRDITTPNFLPGLVLIKADTAVTPSLRLASHSGDAAQPWDAVAGVNRIQSFLSNGFQLGTSVATNATGSTYRVLVIKEGNSVSLINAGVTAWITA